MLIKNLKYNLKANAPITLKMRLKRPLRFFKKVYFQKDGAAQIEAKKTGVLTIGVSHTKKCIRPTTVIMRKGSRLVINGEFSVYGGCSVAVNENATLTLGSGYINCDSKINCFNSITIGEGVAISEDVCIRDSDNHTICGKEQSAPIVIENNVWIGMRACVLKGVTIGEGSVIAAGAVVTRDIPPHSLAAGVPARVIKQNISWQ